jgi:uncharacterized membrane-anchored protein YhcB (DUF1043 family)
MSWWKKIKDFWNRELSIEMNQTEITYEVNGVKKPLTEEQKQKILTHSTRVFQKSAEIFEDTAKLFRDLK